MAGHTSMPPRSQKTPHGDVTLTSRWMRDSYNLMAYGPEAAVRWMFPSVLHFEQRAAGVRHTFLPSSQPITVERVLRKVCERWQEKWTQQLEDGDQNIPLVPLRPTVPSTLGELFSHHQAHFVGQVSEQTKYKYPLHMADWLKELGSTTRLADLTSEAIIAARAVIQKRRKVTDSTMNGRARTLKMMLNLAHKKKWVLHSCWEDVPDLRVIQPPVRYWEPSHAAIAFRVAEADTSRSLAVLMLALGLFLGLRKNEAVNIRWRDLILDRVHPRTGKLSPICSIQQRPGFTTKDYENRIIPISEEALRIFLEHRPANFKPDDYVLVSEKPMPKHGGTKRVYRYDPYKVWERVRDAAMTAGAPFMLFKEMRHSFACACLKAGHSAEEVARWLGHSTTQMVNEHYAHKLEYDESPMFKLLG